MIDGQDLRLFAGLPLVAQQQHSPLEAQLQDTLNVVPAHVWYAAPSGALTFVNQRCADYLGLPEHHPLRLGIDMGAEWDAHIALLHPEDREDSRRAWSTSLRLGCAAEVTFRVCNADGAYRCFLSRAEPVRASDGTLLCWVGVNTDIQERKQTESCLAEAQRLVHMGSWVWQVAGGDALHLSEEWYRIYGFDPRRGMPLWEERLQRVHPEDRDKWQGTIERAVRAKSDYDVQFRILLPDGTIKWVQTVGHPVLSTAGEVVQFIGISMDVTDRKRSVDELKAAFEEIQQLKDQLYRENLALRDQVDRASMFEEIVGTSKPLKAVFSQAAKVAPTDATVLITGETGTGKELIARAVHKSSARSEHAFITVNCAAFAPTLISSELFGHEKGAFTGATQRRLGRFELADGGTIFLDEVGDLPHDTQVALLRVLQEREFERVGGTQPIKVDVRVIAATNRDLTSAVSSGSFRSDLFYRLQVFPLEIPPLRERREDIALLVEYFIDRYSRKARKNIRHVSPETLESLQSYAWPGNIRELQNVIERSVILCDTETFSIDESWLPQQPQPFLAAKPKSQMELPRRLEEQEQNMIEDALKACRGRVFGPAGAAAKLGIPRSTLESRILSLKIDKNRFRTSPGS
jgi:PAS domain S-box-containing protein